LFGFHFEGNDPNYIIDAYGFLINLED